MGFVNEEKFIFRITKDGELRTEYKGKPGPTCVDEVKAVLAHIGGHEVTDEGNTGDYYKPPIEQEVRRWTNQ